MWASLNLKQTYNIRFSKWLLIKVTTWAQLAKIHQCLAVAFFRGESNQVTLKFINHTCWPNLSNQTMLLMKRWKINRMRSWIGRCRMPANWGLLCLTPKHPPSMIAFQEMYYLQVALLSPVVKVLTVSPENILTLSSKLNLKPHFRWTCTMTSKMPSQDSFATTNKYLKIMLVLKKSPCTHF